MLSTHVVEQLEAAAAHSAQEWSLDSLWRERQQKTQTNHRDWGGAHTYLQDGVFFKKHKLCVMCLTQPGWGLEKQPQRMANGVW